jgi:putative resolvase
MKLAHVSGFRIDRLKWYFLLVERLYTLKEAKELLGVTTKAIQRWDRGGDKGCWDDWWGEDAESEIKRILGLKEERVVVSYAGVSSTTRKDDTQLR